MEQDNDTLIIEQFNKLPKELQESINSLRWRPLLKSIAAGFNLSTTQQAALDRETMLILYGFENPLGYPANLARELKINEELALQIVETVTAQIFDPINRKAGGSPAVPQPQTAVPQQEARLAPAPAVSLEVAPEILPMVEKGETAHDVTPVKIERVEKKEEVKPQPLEMPNVVEVKKIPEPVAPKPAPEMKKAEAPKVSIPTPNYNYPGGVDPYREPLG